jgi:Lrp/AsnC family transcriptional regulator, leucine-responsive regulatory protein
MNNFVSLSRLSSDSMATAATSAVLDAFDRTILTELAQNGRVSFRELARATHLSPNATAERVRKLEAAGVIRGFSVNISPSALGLHLQAFVDIKLQKGTSMEAFEKALRGIAGVQEAASVTGQFDARLKIVCRDPDHLGALIEQIRAKTGVQETSSTVICKELLMDPERPVRPSRTRSR